MSTIFSFARSIRSLLLAPGPRSAALLLTLAACLATPAFATTFVMVSDADLVAQAPLIVVGRVVASEPALGAGDLPATDYQLEVERRLKGAEPGGAITLRVPGGIGPDGLGYKVWGAPTLAEGERAIFFLVPDLDGTYHSLHLMLGVFRELPGPRQGPLAWRDLTDTAQLKTSPDGSGTLAASLVSDPLDLPRDFARFANWIALGSTSNASPDYFVDPEAAAPFTKFTFISGNDGVPIRWFTFDTGGSVTWQALASGQPGLPGGGFGELQAGMQIWNDDPTTPVRYVYIGTTPNTSTSCQQLNGFGRVVFDDPLGTISEQYSCATGGVLAQAGPCFSPSLESYNGRQYHPTAGGFAVTNDGVACFFQGTGQPNVVAAELFAHEMGHTLGLGHSATSSALMFAQLHNDGRGASLTADDRNGINEIYGSGAPPPGKPAAPSNLSAVSLSSSQIRVSWSDNSNNETGFRIEQRPTGGTFQQVGSTGVNASQFTVGGLAASTAYEFRVRAVNGNGNSGYSNVAGATTNPPPGFPASPTGLSAQVLSASSIRLTWADNASNETGYQVERKQFGGFELFATTGPGASQLTATGLDSASPYSFRVRAVNVIGQSAYTNVVATETRGLVGPCVGSDTTMCLQSGAVRIQVNWRNQRNGQEGVGHAVPGTNKSGFFWFFNEQNIELVVKALDGRPVNGFYWLFYGGLSDVEYWVRVTQTGTGEVEIYRNPPGELCGEGDTSALLGIESSSLAAPVLSSGTIAPKAAVRDLVDGSALAATTGLCQPGPTRLCLLGNRFEVEVDWINQHAGGTQGVGTPVTESDKSGFFWFFNAQNIELVVKVLDGRPVNGKFWFFYGALSNVEYTLRVRDTVTGVMRTYRNPPGEICGLGDTEAFQP